ncbi:MAG: hypothetical protein CM1200mP1_01890 [Candidatus Neomarinimicrobiota bacterium]|nr:MAG: hypothetical protein CM1200mP1_01890 [Candidatus Neomarinimicrobiota bacterium]
MREATRLIYNEDYWPYSIEDKREEDVHSLQAVRNNIIVLVLGTKCKHILN